jgi:hypothetical protein
MSKRKQSPYAPQGPLVVPEGDGRNPIINYWVAMDRQMHFEQGNVARAWQGIGKTWGTDQRYIPFNNAMDKITHNQGFFKPKSLKHLALSNIPTSSLPEANIIMRRGTVGTPMQID